MKSKISFTKKFRTSRPTKCSGTLIKMVTSSMILNRLTPTLTNNNYYTSQLQNNEEDKQQLLHKVSYPILKIDNCTAVQQSTR